MVEAADNILVEEQKLEEGHNLPEEAHDGQGEVVDVQEVVELAVEA